MVLLKFALISSTGQGYEVNFNTMKTTNITSVHGRNAVLQCPFDKSKNFAVRNLINKTFCILVEYCALQLSLLIPGYLVPAEKRRELGNSGIR